MATQTTNYGLTKPSYNETADIGVINSNMDIIDAKMKEIDNKAGSGGGGGNTDTYGHVKVGSVTIDASGDDTIELVAGSNVTLTPDTTSKSVTISATGGGGGGTSVTVDSELSTTSENPVQNKVITQALNEKGTYSKPTGGIPKTDLASGVQTSLGKADTALQEHQDISGKADKTDLTALSNTISDAWNASTTYAVGQYCIYNNLLWKCLIQHSGQTPTEGTYWTKVSVANEITSVNNSLIANSKHFYFDYKNGKYGYNTNPNRGADTFVPFKNGVTLIDSDLYKSKTYALKSGKYLFDCCMFSSYATLSHFDLTIDGTTINVEDSIGSEYTSTNGTLKLLSAKPNSNNMAGFGSASVVVELNLNKNANVGVSYTASHNPGGMAVSVFEN